MNFLKLKRIASRCIRVMFKAANLEVGNCLSDSSLALKRHDDAKNDIGKATLSNVCQMLKGVTGINVKMLVATLITIVFAACNEQGEVTPLEPNFVEITIPDAYKSLSNGRIPSEDIDDVILDVQITTTDGREVMGKIHLIMHDDETLSYFAMTENLLAETGLSPDYWVEALNANANGRIDLAQGCFTNCSEMYSDDRKRRRGCKAECWLEIALAVAAIVVAAI